MYPLGYNYVPYFEWGALEINQISRQYCEEIYCTVNTNKSLLVNIVLSFG